VLFALFEATTFAPIYAGDVIVPLERVTFTAELALPVPTGKVRVAGVAVTTFLNSPVLEASTKDASETPPLTVPFNVKLCVPKVTTPLVRVKDPFIATSELNDMPLLLLIVNEPKESAITDDEIVCAEEPFSIMLDVALDE
jgi:hypothetical protein